MWSSIQNGYSFWCFWFWKLLFREHRPDFFFLCRTLGYHWDKKWIVMLKASVFLIVVFAEECTSLLHSRWMTLLELQKQIKSVCMFIVQHNTLTKWLSVLSTQSSDMEEPASIAEALTTMLKLNMPSAAPAYLVYQLHIPCPVSYGVRQDCWTSLGRDRPPEFGTAE